LSLLASIALGSLQDETRGDDATSGEHEEFSSDPNRTDPCALEFDTPDSLHEVIGQYHGAPIHRSAIFGGVEYEYDRIYTPGFHSLTLEERVMVPGLVYVRRMT
jgi:hypothetical protein